MANLLNQEYTRYGENLDYIWSNTVRFIRKYTEMFQLGFHDIKWKNKRATPGTAYIPTEVSAYIVLCDKYAKINQGAM